MGLALTTRVTALSRRTALRLGGLYLPLVVSACTTQSVEPKEVERAQMMPWTDAVPPYRLSPGDKIRVFYQRTPELNETAVVGPDGTVGLRPAGRVPALGRTLAEMDIAIARAATRMLATPVVDVVLDDAAGAVVYVGGSVREAGVYPLTGRVGVLEAIVRAKGFDPEARMTEVVLIRRNAQNRPMLRTIDVRNFLSAAVLDDDVPLVAGDIVFVPRSRIAELNLWIDQFITRVLPFSRSFSYTMQTGAAGLAL